MNKHKLSDLDILSLPRYIPIIREPSKLFIKAVLVIRFKGWKSFRVLEFFQQFFVSPQAGLLKKA